jgi:hypothetical protein
MSEHSLPTKICTTVLAFVTVIAFATSSAAQSAPQKADSISTFATPSSAQSVKAHSADAKKKKKPVPTPGPDHSAAAPPAASENASHQAQNPLTPLYSIINENDTNPGVGPFHRTQNVLLVEPVVPIRLTPEFNLVTRWITPVIWEPALAPSIAGSAI